MNNHFKLTKQFHSPDYKATVFEYEHAKTKTPHIHIKPDTPFNQENSCCITLRTPAQNSHGTPHVLEHLVLNGSRKYNVKNVFHNMASRSCSTFMNAMTGSDKTYYPFTSQNEQDYRNLLDVYLDSIFHANMLEVDYWQEGWRLHFNDEGRLEYKGVVFNEMKGMFSSEINDIYYNLKANIFKNSSYKNYSGGEPSEVVKMTYKEIKEFYETYYHPSNALILTYGTQNIEQTQRIISESLANFDFKDIVIEPWNYLEEPSYMNSESHIEIEHFNVKEENENQLILTWFTNDTANYKESLKINLFTQMLLAQDSAVQKMCDNKNYVLSDFLGHATNFRQTIFMLGVQKAALPDMSAIKTDLIASLQEFKKQKFSKERLHNLLDEIEMNLKEQSSNRTPYSTDLLINLSDMVSYDYEAEKELDMTSSIKALRQEIEEGRFIEKIVDKYFSAQRVKTVISKANAQLYEQKIIKEKMDLQKIESSLTAQEKRDIMEQNKIIKEYQEQVYDYSVLPKLNLSHISTQKDKTLYVPSEIIGGINFYQTQNDISYVNFYFDTPETSFSLYDSILKNIYHSYLQNYASIAGLSVEASNLVKEKNIYNFQMKNPVFSDKKSDTISMKYLFAGKNIDANSQSLIDTMFSAVFDATFENNEKLILSLKEFLNTIENHNELGQSLVKQIMLQDTSAGSHLNADNLKAQSIHKMREYIRNILDSRENIEIFMENMRDYHKSVISNPLLINFIGQKKDIPLLQAQIQRRSIKMSHGSTLKSLFDNSTTDLSASVQLNATMKTLNDTPFSPKKIVLTGPTNVGYNYRIYKIDTQNPKIRANLKVIASLMESEFLIPSIREKGGAYGAGASFSDNTFIFSTYRDPEFIKSFSNFQAAIDNFDKIQINDELLENTIISIVGNVNSVGNIRQKISNSFIQDVEDSQESQQIMVQEILKVNLGTMKETVRQYLLCKPYQEYSYHTEKVEVTPEWSVTSLVDPARHCSPSSFKR